jgi:hypothetical protein
LGPQYLLQMRFPTETQQEIQAPIRPFWPPVIPLSTGILPENGTETVALVQQLPIKIRHMFKIRCIYRGPARSPPAPGDAEQCHQAVANFFATRPPIPVTAAETEIECLAPSSRLTRQGANCSGCKRYPHYCSHDLYPVIGRPTQVRQIQTVYHSDKSWGVVSVTYFGASDGNKKTADGKTKTKRNHQQT